MISVAVNPPKTPVTKGSMGTACATIPNVCKMPGPPAPFVPVPLPNIGKSMLSPKDYSKDVTIEGNAVAIKGSTFESIGDIASKGTGGGLISANTHGITKFVGPGSMDVKIEGKNVQFLSDPMLNNCGPGGSPPNSATLVGVIQATGMLTVVEAGTCPVCGKKHGAFKETGGTKADAKGLSNEFHDRVREQVNQPYSTMLAVVRCRTCKKKYGDHSSGTLKEFTKAADAAGILHPEPTDSFADRPDGKASAAVRDARRKRAMDAMRARIGDNADVVATNAKRRVQKSAQGGPAAYPLGMCGAQGALVFALDRKALPGAMTERLYSIKKEGSKTVAGNPTADIEHDVVGKDGVRRRAVLRGFKSGETVPPCKTCELVVPVLICPEPEYQCRCG
jgi:hypothetical protein